MDQPLIAALFVTFKRVLAPASLAALLACASAAAQQLTDPTRPPQTGPAGMSAPVPSGPVLQTIRISPSRAEAMIDGRFVHLGDRVGNARVVTISESTVVLRHATGITTLKLFPGIEKRAADGLNPASSLRQESKK